MTAGFLVTSTDREFDTAVFSTLKEAKEYTETELKESEVEEPAYIINLDSGKVIAKAERQKNPVVWAKMKGY